MPLLFEQAVDHEGALAVWWMKEDESFFIERLPLHDSEKEWLSTIKGSKRRLEWLASRYLIRHLLGNKKKLVLLKDEHGKPRLQNESRQISISHSHEMAAAMIANTPCGIDIQYPVEKIVRLAPKFCSKSESAWISKRMSIDVLHRIWGAKECMYKAYGLRQLDFKDNLRVKSIKDLLNGQAKGRLKKPDLKIRFSLFAQMVMEYYLIWCFREDEKKIESTT